MANVLRALDTSNAWSSDDSDEETHFREMVQLSIQARRLEPKGTGDDAVDEDASNVPAARDTVLDSSDDDAGADDDAGDDARGDASSEPPAPRGDGDVVSGDSPPRETKRSASPLETRGVSRRCESPPSLTDVLASMSATSAMEPAAPELVAALAALGIDVDDGVMRSTARGRKSVSSPSPFGARAPRHPLDFALPVRTGGGYDVRARAESENAKRRSRETTAPRVGASATRPPAARRAGRDSTRTDTTRTPVNSSWSHKKESTKKHCERLEIYRQEVVSYGRLTDNEHFGHWPHLWWSDDDADAVASALSTSSATSFPTPFPVGLTVRTSLRLSRKGSSRRAEQSDGGKENRNRFGGRVVARGDDGATQNAWGSVECSVRERRAGRPWEGPEFCIRWLDSKGSKDSTKGSSKVSRGHFRDGKEPFRGVTPRDAVDGFARALALDARTRANFILPTAESLFGFSSSAVADALAENALCAGRAVARLRAPHGVGLATLRVDALERRAETEKNNKDSETGEAPVAEWRSSFGSFPLLPGYRVTFPLCFGMSAACEVVRSFETTAGVAFAVTVFDGGAAVKKVTGRCPDKVWARLPNERRFIVVSGLLDARLDLDRTEHFLGAHLFGLESPVTLRMASQSETAAETGDAFLLAEPFLRDVYGAKERAKLNKGVDEETKRKSAAEYL